MVRAAFGLPFFASRRQRACDLTRKDPPGDLWRVTGGPFLMPGGTVEDRRNRRRRKSNAALSPASWRALVAPGSCGRGGQRDGGSCADGEVEERRRPRRGRCADCASTHVLISDDSLLRRRDLAEVIGAALAAKAFGVGHRRVGHGRRGAGVDGAWLASALRGQRRGDPGRGSPCWPMTWTRCSAAVAPTGNVVGRRGRGHRGGRPGGVAAARLRSSRGRSRRRPAAGGCFPTRVAPGRRRAERSTSGLRRSSCQEALWMTVIVTWRCSATR